MIIKILTYINPIQYYYKKSDKNLLSFSTIESSTLINLNNEENPKNKEKPKEVPFVDEIKEETMEELKVESVESDLAEQLS